MNKKILKHAKAVIITFILVFVMTFAFYTVGLSSSGGGHLSKVKTPSMEPEYSVGDYIVTEKVNVNDLKVHDVVIYISEDEEIAGQSVAHRIINIEETPEGRIFTVKGDANPGADELKIDGKSIISKVKGKAEFATVFSKILFNPITYVVLAAFICVYISAYGFYVYYKAKKDEENIRNIIISKGLDPEDKELLKLVNEFGTEILEKLNKTEK